MSGSDLINAFVYWIEQLVYGFSGVWAWLNTPLIEFSDFTFTPLSVFGFAGLSAVLVYCLVKWVIPI